ncbi:hypothetical protein ISS05_04650 [Candidatus Woesearchaeota archaeon]|nr:hypothetical protein [Candidatus Woesearchaeota archaeon]
MIEWFVSIISIIFVAYLLFTFTTYTILGVNIVLLIVLAILINKNLKKKEMVRYYLIALLLTSLVLIFSDYGIFYTLLRILEKNLFLSIVTQVLLLVYAFANLSILLTNSTNELIKKIK